MPDPHSIAQARSRLPRLVREAESGEPVELTRHGKRVAVLLGADDYDRLRAARGSFVRRYRDFRARTALEALAIEPEALFGALRDRGGGRDVDL